MKKQLMLIGCMVLLALSSCKNNDDDAGNIPQSENCEMSWTVNGTNYSADMELCIFLDGTLQLTENTNPTNNNSLQVDPISSTGTFTSSASEVAIILVLNDGTQILSLDAEVIVTTLSDSEAKGTFSGTFYDFMDITQSPDYTVTNGNFEASF